MTSNEPVPPPDSSDPREKKDSTASISVQVGRDLDGNVIVGTDNTINQSKNYNFLGYSVALGIVLLAVVMLWYREVQKDKYNLTPMAGNLNVAVARFMDWTDGKCGIGKDAGLLLANTFYKRFESDQESDDFYRSTNILMELRSPGVLYPLQGQDEQELLKSVEELTATINAHIVVYGVLTCSTLTQNATYQIMFYVAPSSFSDAQELIGEFAFEADTLHGEGNAGAEFLELNRNLQEKIEIISLLIKGIGSFWGEDYLRSLDFLAKALDSKLWDSESGQEVIHILAGNSESKYAQSLLVAGNKENAFSAIERAREHYLIANELTIAQGRGDYGRSYIGLASVESFYKLQKSQLTNNIEDIDLAALEREKAALEAAEHASYNPVTSDIPEKVAFNRALIDLLLYQLNKSKLYLSSARANFRTVIESYNQGNIRVREMAAHSYAGLAILERIDGDRANAIENYQQAAKITRIPSLQAQYLLQIGNTYYEDKTLDKALEYYREALKREKDLENRVPPSTIEELENRIVEIEQALPTLTP